MNEQEISELEFFRQQVLGEATIEEDGPPLRRTLLVPPSMSFDIEALVQNSDGMSRNKVMLGLMRVGMEALRKASSPEECSRMFALKGREAFERSQNHE